MNLPLIAITDFHRPAIGNPGRQPRID